MLRPAVIARHRPRREHLVSTLAIGVAFFLVFVGAAALDLNLARLRESFSWVDHTDHVLVETSFLQNEIIDSGAAVRTFAATGQLAALDRLTVAHAQMPSALDELRRLCADNPAQLHRLDLIGSLVARRAVWDDDQVHVRQATTRNDPLVETPESRQLGAELRSELREFRSTEIALLAERQRRVSRDATITTGLAAGTMVLSVLSGGLGIALLQRERQRHRFSELETELIHVSRLNTVGQTASVLAHEVNQPLTATRNYLNGARRLLRSLSEPQAAKASEALSLAQSQIERASQIIARLRRHVQGEGPDRSRAAPAALIEEGVLLSGMRGNADLELRVELERNLPDIFVDSVQVQQVLINLMRNAGEAMAGCPRRVLRIAANRDRDSIRVTVQDTGAGLAPGLSERLFRPFTTTKPDGMGVGLSICRSIVEAHGGRIWAEPAEGGGTIFAFTLPLARTPAQAGNATPPEPNGANQVPSTS